MDIVGVEYVLESHHLAEVKRLQERVLVLKGALRAIRDNGMDAYMCMLAARVALATEPQP